MFCSLVYSSLIIAQSLFKIESVGMCLPTRRFVMEWSNTSLCLTSGNHSICSVFVNTYPLINCWGKRALWHHQPVQKAFHSGTLLDFLLAWLCDAFFIALLFACLRVCVLAWLPTGVLACLHCLLACWHGSWLHGCIVAWWHGCMLTRMHGCILTCFFPCRLACLQVYLHIGFQLCESVYLWWEVFDLFKVIRTFEKTCFMPASYL